MSAFHMGEEAMDRMFRDVIEDLLAEGCSIVAYPLLLAHPGDNVFRVLLSHMTDATDEQWDAWTTGDLEAVSEWLQVPIEEVDEHPPMSETMILVEAVNRLGFDLETEDPRIEELDARLRMWIDGFSAGHLFDPTRPNIQATPVLSDVEGTVSQEPAISAADLAEILDQPPVNGWLLVGSDPSYPTEKDLAELSEDQNARMLWTAPRQIQPGDLVLIYFMAPRKAAHFVARAGSYPFFDPTIGVNADKPVDPHQWWVELVRTKAVPPLPLAALRDLMDGHLILRGKPVHYLPPKVIEGVNRFLVDNGGSQIPVPVGSPALPDPASMSLEQWRALSGGNLRLEAEVERYVVEPLLRLALEGSSSATVQRALRLPVGVPDYVVKDATTVLAAVEVKIGVRTPRDEDWANAPEIHQVLRYMRHLDVPGVLIDVNRIFLLNRGAADPHRIIERQSMDATVLTVLTRHLLGWSIDLGS